MRFFLKFLLFFQIFFICVSVSAESQTCEDLFISQTQPSQVTKVSKKLLALGIRAFLKTPFKNEISPKLGGLFQYSEPKIRKWRWSQNIDAILSHVPAKLSSKLFDDPNYRLAPLEMIFDWAVRKPVEWTTENLTTSKKTPTLLVKLSFLTALSVISYDYVDKSYGVELQKHVVVESHLQQKTLQADIDNDYRFYRVKVAVERKEITPDKALQEALLIQVAYNQYYSFIDGKDNLNKHDIDNLLNTYLFADLHFRISKGVVPEIGFVTPDQSVGPMPDDIVSELVANRQIRAMRYELIRQIVEKPEYAEQFSGNEKMKALVEQSFNTPFYTELHQLYQAGNISKAKLQFFLQEDAYWQSQFNEWSILGIQKLKRHNGSWTPDTLKLSDIENEILQDAIVSKSN